MNFLISDLSLHPRPGAAPSAPSSETYDTSDVAHQPSGRCHFPPPRVGRPSRFSVFVNGGKRSCRLSGLVFRPSRWRADRRLGCRGPSHLLPLCRRWENNHGSWWEEFLLHILCNNAYIYARIPSSNCSMGALARLTTMKNRRLHKESWENRVWHHPQLSKTWKLSVICLIWIKQSKTKTELQHESELEGAAKEQLLMFKMSSEWVNIVPQWLL